MLKNSAMKKMKKMEKNDKKNDLFKSMLYEFMLNYSDRLESDRVEIIDRVSLHYLSSDDLYDMIVNDIRQDTARSIFRSIRSLIKDYLE